MLSALAWLPRGAAKPIPRAAAPTEEELAEAARLQAAAAAAKKGRGGSSSGEDDNDASSSSSGWETDESGSADGMEADDDDDGAAPPTPAPGPELARAKKAAARVKAAGKSPATNDPALDAAMAALDMDNYDREDETDEEEEGDDDEAMDGGAARGSRRVLDGLFGGDDALYYASNAEDPYMALARGAAARGGEEAGGNAAADDAVPDAPASDSEDEDAWDLRPSDFVLAAARTEDDVSTLEVWVYEAGARGEGANLYVHHDLLLGAFPLSLAWMDCTPGGAASGAERANFVAVGTMDPVVELWDLDAADAVSPVATLGEPTAKAKAGQKKKKGTKAAAKAAAKAGGPHAGAVLGLAWNATVRNVLASASADETVKVWDVSAASSSSSSAPVTTLTHHTDKVQALVWHPADPAVLLSGGFDGRACLADVRAPGAAGKAPSWAVGSDVEALAWDPSNPTHFCVASEGGTVTAFDARSGGGSKPMFTLGAHSRPTTGLAFAGPAAPGLLATGSTDKQVKLWDVSGSAPVCVEAQDLKVGAVFAMGFAADDALPGVLAVAGAKGTVAVWEVGASDKVAERWAALAA